MNNTVCTGPFKDIIPLYVKYKQSQGYKYEAGSKLLYAMDKYFKDNGCINIEMPEKIVLNFCKRKNDRESNNTIYKRQHIAKEFALFLKEQGYQNIYVYGYEYLNSHSNFQPYIFTDEEIKKIFKYIDSCDFKDSLKVRDKNFVDNFKTIIRLTYCCGLRSSEVRNIKLQDIDFNDGTILIRESKNNCTRLIPVSNTILDVLKEHNKKFNLSIDDYIFKSSKGKKYDKHLSEKFKEVLEKLNIATETGNSPRFHDLRFTFAVKSLEKMQEENQDIYCTLPILSVYMGHKNITCTEYYLKYTKSIRDKINNKMIDFNKEVFLEENGEENE